MAEDLEVDRVSTESIEITSKLRHYTFEAKRRATGRCYMKITVSTKDLSSHPSLTPNPGHHAIRDKESSTFQECLSGMQDHVKEDGVIEKALGWANTLP